MRVILASQSPARRAMLTAAGVPHEARPAHVDEEAIADSLVAQSAGPVRIADALAEVKAAKISGGHPGVLVLGSDTIVVAANGELVAKPETRSVAETQLRRLAGSTHRLISAAVICEDGKPVWRAYGSARLTMRPLTDEFIAAYLDLEGEAVLGCVGCYRIEGLGAQLFSKVEGDQFTIRGLPLLAVLDYLRARGVLPS
jgi:septum formation protein